MPKLWRKIHDTNEQRLEELRQQIAVGTEQIQQGKVTDGKIVFAKLQEKISQMSQ